MTSLVLIVDDDASTRQIYKHILENGGFQVMEADNGKTGLAMLERLTPDLVLLDMRLPFYTGEDLLKVIYDSPHLSRTRVIVITAHHKYGSLTLREGDTILLKPVTTAVLRQTLIGQQSARP
jgi:CheY-like chemotaxis protein